nr:hypothetical protein [Tanacetum cinerariifolium]
SVVEDLDEAANKVNVCLQASTIYYISRDRRRALGKDEGI